MELHHTFTVPAPVDRTWETFMDLQGVGGCFPGATVTRVDGDSFDGTCKVKLGPIALVYAGSGTFVERDDATHHAVIEAMGKDKRGNGTAGATVTISLAPAGEGTSVDVTTDLNVTGKPAQFGRGVMQDVSDKLLGQFVACLEQRFVEPEPEPEAEPEAPAVDEAIASGTSAAPATEELDVTAKAATAPSTPAIPRSAPRPAPRAAPETDDSLNLGAAVIPVLLKSYAPHALAALVGLLIGVLLGRRGSGRG
ncbi:SRPBCC family protein [Lapillicoccus sp.]|uniref:SRPBCC family protein n=1 Tax=Lapillicoccus sp. TaxID=1909287 RepID=UPI003983CA5A